MVNERFAELMAKGQTGRLSPTETEELARALTAPILDPLANPPSGFLYDHLHRGGQFVIATHSPIIMAYPDAWI
jgi:hypothetical protein